MDVLLVSLPFGPLNSPSLGLSLLQAGLAEKGVGARIRYATFDFARAVGVETYQAIANHPWAQELVGDWVFASEGQDLAEEWAYLRDVVLGGHPDHRKADAASAEALLPHLRVARAAAPAFLDALAQEIALTRPRVVGFTSVFAQTAASLALARRLKARRPEAALVLGGANAEDPMGRALFEAYPELDWVVSGEGDGAFPEAVASFLARGRLPAWPGFHVRSWLAEEGSRPKPALAHLDELPQPAFGDFFTQGQDLELNGPRELLFETSRGCWWGARQHCTFCGLNGASMAFRSKTPERAFEELQALVAAHPGHPVTVVDNILDHAYLDTLVPRLAEAGGQIPLFFEVKANLTQPQLRLLKRAGITRIQPGIESLDDGVLKLMRKGVRALQNVQLLKGCAELGIEVGWNLLGGFPREEPEAYSRMAALLPLLHHLPPPLCGELIRLDRFSPNFEQAEGLGLANVRPFPAYAYVHRQPAARLQQLAYHFAADHADGRDVEPYFAPLRKAVADWRAAAGRESLVATDDGNRILVLDGRRVATKPLHILDGGEAEALRRCASVAPRRDLDTEAVEALQAKRLVLVSEGGGVLALPLM